VLGLGGEGDVAGRRLGAPPHDLDQLVADAPGRDLGGPEKGGRWAVRLCHQGEQHVLGADVGVVQQARLLLGQHHDPSRLLGEPLEHPASPRSPVDLVCDFLPWPTVVVVRSVFGGS
jgi:hypothetical protein